MSSFRVALYPVGKVDAAEVESALARAVKVLGRPIELRGKVAVPAGVEDNVRRQFRAANLLARLISDTAPVGSGRLIGSDERPLPGQDAKICITDVDLFTAKTDGVFAALSTPDKIGVVSLRRLREAFYRRPADPEKHKDRLAREILRVIARLWGAPECGDPSCLVSGSRTVADIDLKQEKFCRACSQRLFEGKLSL